MGPTLIKCRRAILEYAEATINIIDMNHGVIVQAFDQFGARLVQDTARINKIASFVKDMCFVANLDHFEELIKYLRSTGYVVKSQEEKFTVKVNEEFHPDFNYMGIAN